MTAVAAARVAASPAPRRKPPGLPLVGCTDFSPNAWHAADVAAALAMNSGAGLTLVHVTDESIQSKRPSVRRRASTQLRQEADRLRSAGASVHDVLLHGSNARTAIASYLHAHRAALAVVASSNKRALERWSLGSVSEGVAESASCPTLIVHQPRPLLEWALERAPLKIFAAIDSGPEGDGVLRWLAGFAQLAPSTVVLAHVNWPPHTQIELDAPGPLVTRTNAPSVQRVLHRSFEQKARALLGANLAKVLIQPSWGRTDAALLKLARREHAHVFVTGTSQQHGLQRLYHPSVSRGVLRHAAMNVVCVPLPAGENLPPAPIPRFHRVLVTTDFSPVGNSAIAYAYSVVTAGGRVELLHVIPPASPANPLIANYKPSGTTPGRQRRIVKELRHQLCGLVPVCGIDPHIQSITSIVQSTDTAKAICREATRFGADLICLASHGRGGLGRTVFGSVARAVVTRSPLPVLVVRSMS